MRKSSLLARVAAFALLLLIRLLRLTWRVRVVGRPPDGPGLLAFWHGDQLALMAAPAIPSLAVLVSLSADGDLAARVVDALGFSTIRGSSSRGAVAAGLGLVRRLKRGAKVAVAVDGPRGPRHQAGDGLLRLARRAGAPLLPVAAASSRELRLRSWDRLAVPAPFAKVFVVFGAAVDGCASTVSLPLLQRQLDALWRRGQALAQASRRC